MSDIQFWALAEKITDAVDNDQSLIIDSEDWNKVKRISAVKYKWPKWADSTIPWPKWNTWATWPQWPQGIQGIQGIQWLDWKTVLNWTVDPTTEWVDWDFYINTNTNFIFWPKTTWAWGSWTSLVWPAWSWSWDMLAATYDPTNINWDAFNQDNMVDGITNKNYTATEKTKLSWIENNATADQTALEIKTAYESNANTNAFTDAEKTKLSNQSWTNTWDETTTTLWNTINWATAKTTPVDADMLWLMDSAASNVLKKLSWANVKATLKAYFDTLYNNYVLPTASTTVLGWVKVDWTTITITGWTISSAWWWWSVTTLDMLEVTWTQSTWIISSYRVSQWWTLAKFSAYLEVAPTGANFTIDLKINWITQATATITAWTNSWTTTTFTSNVLTEWDLVTYNITSIGSLVAWADLTVLTNLA